MNNKILSIIVPTYNMEDLLDKCLTSLILENRVQRSMLDVIVVIDGATDRSSDIAHRYAGKYPEMFSVIDKENGNYGSCINAALPHVKGKYVRILDADDSYCTENITDFLDEISKIDADLVLSDYVTVNSIGTVIEIKRYDMQSGRMCEFCDIPYENFIPMHSVCYRSNIFNRIDYHQTEGVSYTDLEWVFHPMSQIKTVFYFPHPIYCYYMGRIGQTVDTNVILRRLSHMEKGLWTQIVICDKITTVSISHYNYLLSVLKYRIKTLYVMGLDRKSIFDLKKFDETLKKMSPNLYVLAEKITVPVGIYGWKMPIVKMWRRFKKRNALLIYPIYNLSVIMSYIRRLRK